jgi:hypothetical protein
MDIHIHKGMNMNICIALLSQSVHTYEVVYIQYSNMSTLSTFKLVITLVGSSVAAAVATLPSSYDLQFLRNLPSR